MIARLLNGAVVGRTSTRSYRACYCVAQPRARRLRLESLEQRTLLSLGSVTGTVFEDLGRNGAFDPGEPGLAGWTVEAEHYGTPSILHTLQKPIPRPSR